MRLASHLNGVSVNFESGDFAVFKVLSGSDQLAAGASCYHMSCFCIYLSLPINQVDLRLLSALPCLYCVNPVSKLDL